MQHTLLKQKKTKTTTTAIANDYNYIYCRLSSNKSGHEDEDVEDVVDSIVSPLVRQTAPNVNWRTLTVVAAAVTVAETAAAAW